MRIIATKLVAKEANRAMKLERPWISLNTRTDQIDATTPGPIVLIGTAIVMLNLALATKKDICAV